ncbi:Plasmodium vivax Vir protein, putative [Plasmodium vivax]|nr:Plasmodium vivax Vir protein, putative [Plasmodium vivax]
MSNGTLSYLEKLCDQNEDFKKLPSCEQYKKLNDGLNSNTDNDNYCNGICSGNYSYKEEDVNKLCKKDVTNTCRVNCYDIDTKKPRKATLTNEYKKFCKNICNKLIKLSTTLKDEKNIRDRCSYYNYLALEELWKMPDTNTVSNINSNVKNSFTHCEIVTLQTVIQGINRKNVVSNEPCKFYFDGTFNEWKNERYMHDYFKNVHYLKSKTMVNPGNEKYCEYVSKIASLYENYLSECCTYFFFGYYWDHCPNFFKCNKDLNPYKLLKAFNCKDELLPEYPESLVQSLAIDRDVILRSRIEGCRGLICDPFYMAVLFGFSVLGILLLFFFFYKFTPLGSKANRKERMKKEMNHHFEEKAMNHHFEENAMNRHFEEKSMNRHVGEKEKNRHVGGKEKNRHLGGKETNRHLAEKERYKPPPKKSPQGQASASKKRIKIAYHPT